MPQTVSDPKALQKLLEEQDRLVIHFGASWCAPCETVNNALDKTEIPVRSVYVDAENEQMESFVEKFEVENVPTVLFLRKADSLNPNNNVCGVVASIEGANVSGVEFHLRSLFGMKPKSSFPNLNEFLKHLISRDRITIFITGTTTHPRCGFTEKLIKILEDDLGLVDKYTYNDIMEDEEVCQGLKKFSDWPTYPQVYANGELIGGLDICVQMHQKGQLGAALKGE